MACWSGQQSVSLALASASPSFDFDFGIGWNKNKSSGIIWEGSGKDEIGKRADTGEIVIRIDPRYFRPTEVDQLLGDASKARKKLNWKPVLSIEQLISEMIKEDLNEAKKESLLARKGFSIYDFKE